MVCYSLSRRRVSDDLNNFGLERRGTKRIVFGVISENDVKVVGGDGGQSGVTKGHRGTPPDRGGVPYTLISFDRKVVVNRSTNFLLL